MSALSLATEAARVLPSALAGRLVFPDDLAYDELRRVWNGRIAKKPAVIVRCAAAEDVVEAIGFARASGLVVSVRGGGHSIAGNSVCDGGVMIDLSGMKQIHVDPEARTARAGPGLTLGQFDAATQDFGLATTMGVMSDTGIAGLTLGGGLGRLARKHGTSCDNLISAKIVLADGRLVTACPEQHPDLFWALRGGGGNFGVVTSFQYRLHPLGPTILGGLVLHEWPRAKEVLRFYRDFCRSAPDAVSADAALIGSPDGSKMLGIAACYVGSVEKGEHALRPLCEFGPPAQNQIAPMSYVALQSAVDPLLPRGRRYYWKTHLLKEIDEGTIDVLLDSFARVPSPMSIVSLQQLGGAAARVAPEATAYAHRDAAFDCVPICAWENAAEDETNIAWAREMWEALRPFASGRVYVNNLGEEGEDRVRAAYGVNYDRLATVKAKYDPDNLFRLNQNIKPLV